MTAPRSIYTGGDAQNALPGMAGDGVQLGLGLGRVRTWASATACSSTARTCWTTSTRCSFATVLKPSENLTSRDFTVEMETGTGKTYVYLRTIFELNKRYGFTKFVIVVPSVAIKEGRLQEPADHGAALPVACTAASPSSTSCTTPPS